MDLKKKINEEYMQSEISKMKDGDLDLVMDNSKEISHKITHSPTLKKYAELGKILVGMLSDYKRGFYRNVPWFTIGAITFSLLYILNPFDIVPDFIPGLGYIDDLAIFTFAMRFIETDLHNYLDWKIEEKKTEG